MKYRKIYGANGTDLSTTIMVGSKRLRIEFTGGVPVGASRITARYSTTDKAIQDAIESDPRYGNLFFLETIVELEDNIRVEEKGKVRKYNYITRPQDAINILATIYKVPLSDLDGIESIREAAKKKNVSFPNMR